MSQEMMTQMPDDNKNHARSGSLCSTGYGGGRIEYKVGDETASEIHPDDDDVDDLSCITIDSLKHIDNEKVKNIWQGMAKLKRQEGDYYGELAEMVDEMTPKPSTRQYR